jgi:hypothetical protein
VESVRHVNTRQRLARKIIKLTSKQEEENELPATAVREIAVLKSICQENIIKSVLSRPSIHAVHFHSPRLSHVAFEPSFNGGCNHLCIYLEYLPIDLKRYMDALGTGERLSPKLVQVKSAWKVFLF